MHARKSCCARFFYIVCLLFAVSFFIWGCGKKDLPAGSDSDDSVTDVISWHAEEKRQRKLAEGNVSLSADALVSYGRVTGCGFTGGRTLSLTLSLPDLPKSDDALIYLFALEPYETWDAPEVFARGPVASAEKAKECALTWAYEEEQLFRCFVPALLLDGAYVPLSTGYYIDNPEAIAGNQDGYPQSRSKKGLLLDPEMVGTSLLTDLHIQHAIYNIPLSAIVGETTNDLFPTISYSYKGKVYRFDGASIAAYDGLFSYLTDSGILTTAIVLNDWNESFPELIHPLARNKKSGAFYYAFNTAQEEGCLHLEAVASFLTERYSGGEHGLVSSWVVANEINQHKIWNYMDTDDITLYAAEFEKALRIFYLAAKRNYAGAKVYFSVDHDWNSSKEIDNKSYFNGKDLVEAVNNAALSHGNYDWGLAIHPYPEPLTRVNYWTQQYDKTIDSPYLTLMNLSTTIDLLRQEAYWDRSGNVRSITVTELGFTSASGEKLQAAAFAYCYYIIDANPYIEAFIMNRQTDAPEEMRQGLAFGIYEIDRTGKFILDVFKYIDTERAEEYTDFMLNILGAETIEEALSWAQ